MLELDQNILINGKRYYSQRRPVGTGALTPTTTYQYLTNDRFAQKIAGTITTPTVEAANDFPIAKSPWCSKFTGIMASGSSISEQQRVEADFGLHLIGDYISFLTYVTSTSCSKLTVNIGYATAKDNHASQVLLTSKEFTLKTDGSVNEIAWEKISQLSSLISTGLYVEMVLSNPTNTSTSSVHRFGGATLLRSRYAPVETLLASRGLIDELRYCQRYFQNNTFFGYTQVATTGFYLPFKLPYPMRVSHFPVVTSWGTGSVGFVRQVNAGLDKSAQANGVGTDGGGNVLVTTSLTGQDLIAWISLSSTEL